MALTDSGWLTLIIEQRQNVEAMIDIDILVRKLSSSMCQPWECESGSESFVVKFPKIGQTLHQRSFAAEQVVARLGELIGAPVGVPHVVRCNQSIMSLEAELKDYSGEACHATEKVEDLLKEVKSNYELGRSKRDREEAGQLAVLYGWCVAGDRQFLQIKDKGASDFGGIVSVDHGLFFPAAQNWSAADLQNFTAIPDPDAWFLDADPNSIVATKGKVKEVSDEKIAWSIAHVHQTWGVSDDDCVALAKFLSARRDIL